MIQMSRRRLPATAFRSESAYFCPICIAVKPYRRRLWDIEAVHACPEHGLLLQASCFCCGEGISWRSTLTAECSQCGVWLGLAPKQSAPADLLWLSEQIQLQLNAPLGDSATQALSKLSNIYRLVMLILTGGGSAGRGTATLGAISDAQGVDFAIAAASCLRAEPRLVKALLEAQLAEQARVQPLVGAWSWETALRRSLRRYPFNTDAVAEWRGAIEEVLSTPKTVPMPFFVAVAGTNKMHGALITFDEFADWMGVAGKQIRKREARRWLKRNNLLVTYRSETRISVTELERLAAKWLSQSRPETTHDDWITLQHFMRHGPSRWNLSVWQALDAAGEGALGSLSWQPGKRLSDLAFSKSRMLNLVPTEKTTWPYVTLTDAARQAGMYPDAMRRAAKAGLIIAKRVRCPDGYYRDAFAILDWQHFASTYVFSGELAREAQDDPRRFSDKLKDEGIKPASGPGIDGGLVYIFKRTDVENLDLKRIAKKRGYRTSCGRPHSTAAEQRDAQRAQLGLLNSSAASKYVGISIQRLASAVRSKLLKAVKHNGTLGNRRYFRRQDLDAYMAALR
jgi:hypothetical protein